MRRMRQALSDDAAGAILHRGKVCTLAVAGDGGYPYAVPMNYVYDGRDIYLHSARAGHKIDALRRHPKCSLCVVDADEIVPEELTTYFRSAIVFGRAEFIEDPARTERALRLLGAKYAPGVDPTAEIGKCRSSVLIIRIAIDRLTAKEAIELVRRKAANPSATTDTTR